MDCLMSLLWYVWRVSWGNLDELARSVARARSGKVRWWSSRSRIQLSFSRSSMLMATNSLLKHINDAVLCHFASFSLVSFHVGENSFQVHCEGKEWTQVNVQRWSVLKMALQGKCHEPELKVQRMRRNQLSSSFREIMPVAHQEVHALWRSPFWAYVKSMSLAFQVFLGVLFMQDVDGFQLFHNQCDIVTLCAQ